MPGRSSADRVLVTGHWSALGFVREDDVVALAKLLGDSHVIAGSDYPHPEGLLWPAEFADEAEALRDEGIEVLSLPLPPVDDVH